MSDDMREPLLKKSHWQGMPAVSYIIGAHTAQERYYELFTAEPSAAEGSPPPIDAATGLRAEQQLEPGAEERPAVFPQNVIVSSRYTIFNFLPKSLLEQFRRLANVYFLVLGIIAAVAANTNYYETAVEPEGILGPMMLVVFISVIKEGVEDLKRHNADAKVNSRPARRIDAASGAVSVVCWRELRVGDAVLVLGDEEVPADMVLLSCGGVQGPTGYVETAAIDGETNLKMKSPCLLSKTFSDMSTNGRQEAFALSSGSNGEGAESEHHMPREDQGITVSDDRLTVRNLDVYSGSTVAAEAPNGSIHRFNGVLELRVVDGSTGQFLADKSEQRTLSSKNLLLRGSVLRATEWAICAVTYTGADTKLSLNSKKTPSKLSSVDRVVNKTLVVAISTMLLVCIISMAFSIKWEQTEDDSDYLCLHSDDLDSRYPHGGGCENGSTSSFLTIFTFATLYNNFVCISMYVSLEMVYLAQAYFLSNDLKLYDESKDTAAECHNSGMCADLGQIRYVLSDKTGTLTKNQMVVKNFSIARKTFGEAVDGTSKQTHGSEGATHNPLSPAPGSSHGSDAGVDATLAGVRNVLTVEDTQERWLRRQYVRTLVYCNTAMLMPDERGKVIIEDMKSLTSSLQAESPDEVALIEAAAEHCGVLLTARTGHSIECRGLDAFKANSSSGSNGKDGSGTAAFGGELERVELLAVNEFDSDRKMMSVLIRIQDIDLPAAGTSPSASSSSSSRTVLLCKGADSSMLRRCQPAATAFTAACKAHIEAYANTGLRTLVAAMREVSDSEARQWMDSFKEAANSLVDRQEKLCEAAKNIERDMVLLGAIGIEDELQDGVPDAIATLHAADVNVWMITGDKAETALAIGKKCSLIDMQRQDVERLVNLEDEALRQKVVNLHAYVLLRNQRSEQSRKKDGSSMFSWGQRSDASASTAGSIRPTSATPSRVTSINGDAVEDGDPAKAVDFSAASLQQSGGAPMRDSDFFAAADTSDFPSEQEQKPELALVVDGISLEGLWASAELKQKFVETVQLVPTVIACRVSPLQKAALVRMIKAAPDSPVTLAIGDGANDVGMIHESRVGVGISGNEGRHAANSADFAISQFRYLVNLMFDHGRFNYIRCSKLVLYSFFKNLLLVSLLFYFCFYSGFSGTVFVDSIIFSGYNFYLGLPILAVGAFDFDIPRSDVLKYPSLAYATGRKGEMLNIKNMARWCTLAFIEGLLLFSVIIRIIGGPTWAYSDQNEFGLDIRGAGLVAVQSGWSLGMFPEGFTIFTTAILAMQYKVVSISVTPTTVFWVVWLLSFAGYLIFVYLYGLFPLVGWYNTVPLAMGHPCFWLSLLLIPVMLSITDYTADAFWSVADPSSRDKLVALLDADRKAEARAAAAGGDGEGFSSRGSSGGRSSSQGVALHQISGSNSIHDMSPSITTV